MISYDDEWAAALEEAVDEALDRAEETGADPWGDAYDGCLTCVRRVEWKMVMEWTLKGAENGVVECLSLN